MCSSPALFACEHKRYLEVLLGHVICLIPTEVGERICDVYCTPINRGVLNPLKEKCIGFKTVKHFQDFIISLLNLYTARQKSLKG